MPRGEFDRSDRRERTRGQLLEAAARVYAREGVDRATVDDVAKEAGFTKGAVYDHFGSKENLLFALLEEHLASEIGEQLTLFEANRDVLDRPQLGADRWIAHIREDPDALRLFVEAWVIGQRDAATREHVLVGVDAWRGMFRTFAQERSHEVGIWTDEALLDAHGDLMVALGLGFAMLKLTDPEHVPEGLLGAAYLVLLGALESSPDARALIAAAVSRAERPRS